MKTKPISYTPATINPKPSKSLYYGVYAKGYHNGDLRDRAFIRGIGRSLDPQSFEVINMHRVTENNNWDKLRKLTQDNPQISLENFIIKLYDNNFEVIEFNSPASLCAWLAECHE